LWRATRPLLHEFDRPTLSDLNAAGGGIHEVAGSFVGALVGRDEDLVAFGKEYGRVASLLDDRYRDRPLAFPDDWAIESNSSEALYVTVRVHKPALMVEAGVANGHSTSLILAAMEANGEGRLVSIDIDPRVGALVADGSRQRWDLRVMEGGSLPKELRDNLSDLTDIDLFLHDSNHDYRWMEREFGEILPRMRRGGLILADDIDKNHAFLELALRAGVEPRLLWARRKIFGGLRVPS
jgi:hypothetical protein